MSILSVFNKGGEEDSLQFMVNLKSGPGGVEAYLLAYDFMNKSPFSDYRGRSFPADQWVYVRVDVDDQQIVVYLSSDGQTWSFVDKEPMPKGAKAHMIPAGIHGGLYGQAMKGTVWNGPITVRSVQ